MGDGPQLSHKELQDSVESLAFDLLRIGVKSRDLVSLAFLNTLEFIIAFLAVTRIEAIAAPLNSNYTEEEFLFYMEDAGSSFLLLPAVSTPENAKKAAVSLKLPVALVTPYKTESKTFSLLPHSPSDFPPSENSSLSSSLPSPSPDSTALFLHTSGTTSRPKGVPLSHSNLSFSLSTIISTYNLSPSDKTLIVMPLFHVHGLMASLLSTLFSGGTVLLPRTGKFSASTFWTDMKKGQATWYTAVPTIHQILLSKYRETEKDESTKESIPKLRFIRSCSASLAPATKESLELSFSAPVLEAYAMTEASHQMSSNPLPAGGPRKPGSVGKPTGVEMAILDTEGRERETGVVGEVCVRGKNVTKGYRNNEKANEEAFKFGWFHTGDQGFLDEDGYLVLTGRIKELINRGGEKISPLEVDAVILTHPAVAEAVAFAAPDSHYGEEVNAAVVLYPGEKVSEPDLKDFLKVKLSAFKIPKKIFFALEVPRTATGKIQRRFVAEHFLKKTETEKNEIETPETADRKSVV